MFEYASTFLKSQDIQNWLNGQAKEGYRLVSLVHVPDSGGYRATMERNTEVAFTPRMELGE